MSKVAMRGSGRRRLAGARSAYSGPARQTAADAEAGPIGTNEMLPAPVGPSRRTGFIAAPDAAATADREKRPWLAPAVAARSLRRIEPDHDAPLDLALEEAGGDRGNVGQLDHRGHGVEPLEV